MCWNIFITFMITLGIARFFWRVLRYFFGVFLLANTLIFRAGSRQSLDIVERESDPHFEVAAGILLAVVLILAALYIGLVQPARATSGWIAFVLFVAGIAVYIIVASGQFQLPSVYLQDLPPILPRGRIQKYEIRVPQGSAWNREQALHLIDQLAHACPELVLQIEADAQAIRWYVINAFREINPSFIPEIIHSVYPEAVIHPLTSPLQHPDDFPILRYQSFYEQANSFVAPLRRIADLKDFDPLVVLTQAADSLEVGTRLTFVLALGHRAEAAYSEGQRVVTEYAPRIDQWFSLRGVHHALETVFSANTVTERYTSQELHTFTEKLNDNLYYATYFVQIDAPQRAHLFHWVGLVNGLLSHYAQPGFNRLTWLPRDIQRFTQPVRSHDDDVGHDVIACIERWRDARSPQRPPTLILDAQEIAALWHLPHEDCGAGRIAWARPFAPISEMIARVSEGTLIGIGKHQGTPRNVRLPLPDRRTHQSIIGKSGTGKSTLMLHEIRQDILDGYGIAVVDPHGSLIRDVLRTSIPEHRRQDVVVLEIANRDYPPPFNPLIANTSYTGMLRVVNIIDRLYSGTERSPRMASTLRAGLLPLQFEPQPTMRDVVLMFTDPIFREQMLAQVEDPEVLDFWDNYYMLLSPVMQRQVAAPIFHRIRVFYTNPYLYPILCHPRSVDFRDLIQKQKILLISLEVKEELVPKLERDLLGALLISRLQLSGMTDPTASPFYLYIDEAQRFVTTSLAEMLSEARKYNLSLVIANQFFGQIEGETLQAVLGNVSTRITFRCSPEDAQAVVAQLKPQMDTRDLLNLNMYQAAVKMQVKGVTQPAFHLLTLPPPDAPPDAIQEEDRIREGSIARYTPLSRPDVLAWLTKRYGDSKRPAHQPEVSDEESYYE